MTATATVATRTSVPPAPAHVPPPPPAGPLEQVVLSLAELDAYDPHASGSGDERRYCCPLPACRDKPRDRGHQSLCLNRATGLWVCNRCQAKGKLSDEWEARSREEMARVKARRAFQLTPERQAGSAASAAKLPGMLARCRPVAETPGAAYLQQRGIPLDVATGAGVLFSRDWYGRPAVVFPMADQHGQVVAANGRHTDGRNDPKTHTVGDRSLGVFGTCGAWDAALLVIVEGPMDALSLAACGVPALALVATRAPGWLPQRCDFDQAVAVALDADEAGDAGAAVLARTLATFGIPGHRWRTRGCKDWNEALAADPAGLRQLLCRRLPACPYCDAPGWRQWAGEWRCLTHHPDTAPDPD